MKNVVRVVALALVVIMACGILASCGKTLSGKYEAAVAGTGATLEFKGSKVTITFKLLGTNSDSVTATYKIDGDKITITYDDKESKDDSLNGTFDFKENDDKSITIGVVTYKKL